MASPTDPAQTRLSLHAVAELVLAASQYAASGTIRLRASPEGISTVAEPRLLLAGEVLTGPGGDVRVSGQTPRTVAGAVGVAAAELSALYPDGSGRGLDDELSVDDAAARDLLRALALGDEVLRAFAPDQEPVLWPEHFDVGITVDEVNYGVSPGDHFFAEPYAYVGPWQVPAADEFWDAPFGAARSLDSLGTAQAVQRFLEEGRARVGS